jgi:hypothetical protein
LHGRLLAVKRAAIHSQDALIDVPAALGGNEDDVMLNRRCYEFCRALRFDPAFCALPLPDVLRAIRDVGQFFFENDQSDFWRDSFGVGAADVLSTVEDVWLKIRTAPGQSPAASMVAYAEHHPVEFKIGNELVRPPEFWRLMTALCWLQRSKPSKPIVVPQSSLAEALQVSQPTVSRFLRFATCDGFLKKANSYDRPGHRAAEYWFLLETVRR